MKSIIFLETNKSGSSRDAIRAAESLGYHTILLTTRQKAIEQRSEYPDVHVMQYMESFETGAVIDVVRYLEKQGKEIQAIVSFVDTYVYQAAKLADQLGIGRISTKAIFKMEDKLETRKALKNSSITPFYRIISPDEDIESIWKRLKIERFILKSPYSTGSKDVILVENEKQFYKAVHVLRKQDPKTPLLIEEYVEGEQILIEAVVQNGVPQILAILEQEILKAERFIVTGYNVWVNPPEKVHTSLQEVLITIAHSLKIRDGSLHVELRGTPESWKLIEINPRISGGAMNRIIEAAYGVNVVAETLKMVAGEKADFQTKHTKPVFAQYVTLDEGGVLQRVTGRNRALNSPGVVEVYIKPRKGTYLSVPMSMGHRYAYVLATGETREQARLNAKQAAKEITFHLE
ncbi:biotin carboxylase [Bacillus ectoiniformans]|uniref:ATP-grasp domain-containing protein n=1 Tax=Bacillus ectoiniformans TaxID=1494429 RepID=UPI001956D251|nr:ATP-grasp domain-containing protein [Bacillus ectoiniformans]MBM7648231.1 biotin carboxylase [Bacillus ectoiniformans]